MSRQKVTPIIFDTYLALIKNSVGAKLFRHSYAKVNGRRTDILRGGKLSCAFYASSILTIFKLIKEIHATVDSTVKDLRASGWRAIKKPKIGCVLVWQKQNLGRLSTSLKATQSSLKSRESHKHIGFYVGHYQAISNNFKRRCPAKHHWTFGNKRKIELILWSEKLSK